ncbi:hypothetical protein [Treponema sp.]|uniref:hypothetical protein n=1 Tax=Treponema sp. TaxID=166 RepID=UPI003F0C5B51
MKLKKKTVYAGTILLLALALFFTGCKEKTRTAAKTNSDYIIEIQPRETSQNVQRKSLWTNEEGVVCVFFGYGFNIPEFTENALNSLEKKFGLAENGGLILPVIFPDDLHGRISTLRDILEKNRVRGVVLLGAPENTHIPLAKIKEDWNGNLPFNVFSLFPQDDVLGQEFTCNFVIDYEFNEGIQFGDASVQGEWKDALELFMSAVEYASLLPFSLPLDSELYFHVQSIAAKRKIARYVDSETGIQSRNHFIILNSAE